MEVIWSILKHPGMGAYAVCLVAVSILFYGPIVWESEDLSLKAKSRLTLLAPIIVPLSPIFLALFLFGCLLVGTAGLFRLSFPGKQVITKEPSNREKELEKIVEDLTKELGN